MKKKRVCIPPAHKEKGRVVEITLVSQNVLDVGPVRRESELQVLPNDALSVFLMTHEL